MQEGKDDRGQLTMIVKRVTPLCCYCYQATPVMVIIVCLGYPHLASTLNLRTVVELLTFKQQRTQRRILLPLPRGASLYKVCVNS